MPYPKKVVPLGMSPFKQFCERWKAGCGSDQCDAAKKVLCRGTVPCDVLFVGEAPGESEDVIGIPFVGPAGKLQDHVISRAVPAGVRFALANMVGCIPREEAADGSVGKASQPEPEQVEACAPRLIEFVALCRPKLVVCVGTFARDWLDPKYRRSVQLPLMPDVSEIPRVAIDHPAYILRQNKAQQGLSIQRAVVTIMDAIEDNVLARKDE